MAIKEAAKRCTKCSLAGGPDANARRGGDRPDGHKGGLEAVYQM